MSSSIEPSTHAIFDMGGTIFTIKFENICQVRSVSKIIDNKESCGYNPALHTSVWQRMYDI